MLLGSNILIYGADGGEPRLDVERAWLGAAIGRMDDCHAGASLFPPMPVASAT